MKNSIIITVLSFCICLLSACGGGSVPQSGKGDTVKSTYPPTVDSSKFDKDTGRNVKKKKTRQGVEAFYYYLTFVIIYNFTATHLHPWKSQ
jgi:hypothetical protein